MDYHIMHLPSRDWDIAMQLAWDTFLMYEAPDYEASLKIMQTLLLHQMNVKDKEVKTNIFYYLGMLRVKTNDPERAKDMFNRALSVDANHAPTKEALASLG